LFIPDNGLSQFCHPGRGHKNDDDAIGVMIEYWRGEMEYMSVDVCSWIKRLRGEREEKCEIGCGINWIDGELYAACGQRG